MYASCEFTQLISSNFVIDMDQLICMNYCLTLALYAPSAYK